MFAAHPALSALGPVKSGIDPSDAIDLRNRLAAMLVQRISHVRRAARYVFRNHLDILRLSTSSYERNRRLESKRAKSKNKKEGNAAPTPANG